ncbi:unnamed protein product [Cochlearia groenlandica]
MMHNLPEDLLREILSRVPATSLTRLRSTCKRWKDLFEDPQFIKKQRSKALASKQSMLVLLKQAKVYSVDINTDKLITCLKDRYYNSDKFYISDIFYCDGLLLCTTKDKISTKSNKDLSSLYKEKFLYEDLRVYRLVVWNPCLGQTKWTEPIHSICGNFSLGYDNNKKHKILMVCYEQERYEMYDYDKNSWRILHGLDKWYTMERGVSLHGNTYWIGYDATKEEAEDDYADYEPMLISFDFSSEKFRCLSLPEFESYCPSHDMSMSLSHDVREEKMLLLTKRDDILKMDLYVTTIDKTKQDLVWSKFLSVNLHNDNDICFSDETRFFIMEEKKKKKKTVVSCSGLPNCGAYSAHIIGEELENGVREIDFYDDDDYKYTSSNPLLVSYVPSLFQISHLGG